jgi:hypothetical protein
MRKHYIFLLYLFIVYPVLAQDIDRRQALIGVLNLHTRLNDYWNFNSKWEHLAFYTPLQSERQDVELFVSRGISLSQSLGGGVMLRYEIQDRRWVYRFIQQWVYKGEFFTWQYTHRARLDQTTSDGEAIRWRLRYLWAMQRTLSGHRLDAGEPYAKITAEVLGFYHGKPEAIEYRLTAAIGLLHSRQHKFELGLDWRYRNTFVAGGQEMIAIKGAGYFSW